MAYKITLGYWESITNVVSAENYENKWKQIAQWLQCYIELSSNQNTEIWVCVEMWRSTRQKIKCLEMKWNQIDSHASPSHCDSQHGTNLFWTWILLDTQAFCLLVSVWQARLDAN